MTGSRQIHVGRGHVDLRPKRPRAVGKLPLAHPSKQIKVLLDRPVATRAVLARPAQRASILAGFVGREVADVGLALGDQLDGPLVELLKIVRGVILAVAPVESEPTDILLDRLDVLDLFLARIGVVEPEVAQPALVLLGDSEIQADRLGVSDVEISVRLGWESGMHATLVLARLDVLGDDRPDEIDRCGGLGGRHILRFLNSHWVAKEASL